MRLFLKEKNFQKFQFFFQKMFCAFWSLDMAPTLDVLVLFNRRFIEIKQREFHIAFRFIEEEAEVQKYSVTPETLMSHLTTTSMLDGMVTRQKRPIKGYIVFADSFPPIRTNHTISFEFNPFRRIWPSKLTFKISLKTA